MISCMCIIVFNGTLTKASWKYSEKHCCPPKKQKTFHALDILLLM